VSGSSSPPLGASANAGFLGSSGYRGNWWFLNGGNDYNALDFVVRSILSGDVQMAVVTVVSVAGGGAGSPPPTVAVQPMVSQTDGAGNLVPHGIIPGLPVLRWQGGAGAVVLDPVAADIGIAIFADRDISNVKATKGVSGPGSSRQRDWADGVYLGSILSAKPNTFVRITPTAVTIEDATGANVVLTNGTLTANVPNVVVNATHAVVNGPTLQIPNLPSTPTTTSQVYNPNSPSGGPLEISSS
jgi:hypothetical protein